MADVNVQDFDRERRWRGDLPRSQVAAIDQAWARIGEEIAAREAVQKSVREAAWFLQESVHQEVLGNLRLHEEPVQARMQEMFLRGVARGVELLCDHLTDGEQLRAVRGWLSEAVKSGDTE